MLPEPRTDTVEIVEGELVPAVYEPAPLTLFGTSDPRAALAKMGELAGLLVDVVRDRKLSVRIGGREHLFAEAWTTLGGMLGVFAIVEWTKPNETGDGYIARVEARTRDGALVGAAEAECARSESTWAKRDAYALRSMAQTRAVSRALRAPLGQIVVLAGYEPAGAEEIPTVGPPSAPKAEPTPERPAPTREQLGEITALLTSLQNIDPDTDWRQTCRDIIVVPRDLMTSDDAARLIRELQDRLAAFMKEDGGGPQ